MKFFIGILFLFGLAPEFSLAADAVKELKVPDFSEVENELNKRKQRSQASRASCKGLTGKTITEGDPDFSDCATDAVTTGELKGSHRSKVFSKDL